MAIFIIIIFAAMIIKSHIQLSDQEFEEQFETITLAPRLFTHEAHIRLAYIHIQKYGAPQAEENMCIQIKRFATHFGDTEKFNKTVTIAAVKAVYHFLQKSTSNTFSDFIKEFPQLITKFKDLLSAHYGFNVFADPKAKKEFVDPDLLPFT